jgi:hypothetical protein
MNMKIENAARLALAGACLVSLVSCAARNAETPVTTPQNQQKAFNTPETAAEALILAAEQYDVPALQEVLGPDGIDLVVSGDPVQDRNQSVAFAAAAREKTEVARDAEDPTVAILSVGNDAWPLAIPIVEQGGKWRFDTEAGREETLLRRIGRNELQAIEICRGFVEAQHEYALQKRDGAPVNQYAQHVISTPGKQNGLAWQAPDGTWQGPVGERIAEAIAEGYREGQSPYHGYLFKVLKGQGTAAPLGEMDFVVKGYMIGGFALVAAPAEYELTGVKTFIVSHDGVVHEKDLGPGTLEAYKEMDRYDPDPTWSPVAD